VLDLHDSLLENGRGDPLINQFSMPGCFHQTLLPWISKERFSPFCRYLISGSHSLATITTSILARTTIRDRRRNNEARRDEDAPRLRGGGRVSHLHRYIVVIPGRYSPPGRDYLPTYR